MVPVLSEVYLVTVGDIGKYELAIYHQGSICYDTHITNDVIGYLTEDEVTDFLRQIQELEKE